MYTGDRGGRKGRERQKVSPHHSKTENVVVTKSTLFQLNVGHKDVNVS